MRVAGARVLLVAGVIACGTTATPPPPPPAPVVTSSEVPMSDPAEYRIERASAEAGARIFEQTGLGDPYMTGIPYPVFLGLLAAFPTTFGATPTELAEKFGFVARAADPGSFDRDVRAGLPVGMHLTTDPLTGVDLVVTSCALCHAEKLRWAGGEALVYGLANKRVRIHAYDRAFSEITTQAQFSPAVLGGFADEAATRAGLVWPAAYREPFVSATTINLAARARQRAALHAATRADPPGRVAVIESFAVALQQLTGQPVGFAPAVGWAKVPDVIGFAERETLSWDASQAGAMEILLVEADIAAGARIAWLEQHPQQGPSLAAYLRAPARRPPFPGPIQPALAGLGKTIFEKHCADCHGTYAPDGRVLDYDESVVPIDDLGTDPARLHAPTGDYARVANDPALTKGYTKFAVSTGYVPPVLTNVWARAPYGHAGQWPSLAVIATPPLARPTSFSIDFDGLYDLTTVGVPLRANGYVHDATKPGFSVLGHPFLAELGPDATAVIEYLKTL